LLLAELGDAWRGADDAAVFARLGALHDRVDRAASAHGGATVKIHGDGVLAAFPEPVSATRAALELFGEPAGAGVYPSDRVVVHAGPARVTSINDRLDYFGRVVGEAARLLARTAPGQLALGEPVYADPGVTRLLGAVDAERAVIADEGLVGQVLDREPLEAASAMR
jgi:class 3 adenylate cyclase